MKRQWFTTNATLCGGLTRGAFGDALSGRTYNNNGAERRRRYGRLNQQVTIL